MAEFVVTWTTESRARGVVVMWRTAHAHSVHDGGGRSRVSDHVPSVPREKHAGVRHVLDHLRAAVKYCGAEKVNRSEGSRNAHYTSAIPGITIQTIKPNPGA